MAKKSKEKVQPKVPDIGLNVDRKEYVEVTREASGDKWDSDDTSSSWSVDGVYLVDEYPDVTACFPVKAGDTVYLLYAVYSSGDSFHHAENGCIVFVDVFKTHTKAEKAAIVLREQRSWYAQLNNRWSPLSQKERRELSKKYKDAYSANIIREDGSEMPVHVSWNGHFESLSYIEVRGLTVDANKRGRY